MKDFFKFYAEFFPRWDNQLFKKIIKHQRLDLCKQFKKYSRGEKMQLVLIAELCKSPDILLIDEITSVLDVYGRQFYLNLFKEFTQNKNGTIFLTTNIITEVSRYLDHVFVLRNGELVFDDDKKNISNVVVRIEDPNDDYQFENYIQLPDYKLVCAKECLEKQIDNTLTASAEDLFLFMYKVKANKGLYGKAA